MYSRFNRTRRSDRVYKNSQAIPAFKNGSSSEDITEVGSGVKSFLHESTSGYISKKIHTTQPANNFFREVKTNAAFIE